MIDFKTYRLLNEHLGQFNLGVTPVQTLGVNSNRPGFYEMGLPPELSAKKGKPMPDMGDGEDPDAMPDMEDPDAMPDDLDPDAMPEDPDAIPGEEDDEDEDDDEDDEDDDEDADLDHETDLEDPDGMDDMDSMGGPEGMPPDMGGDPGMGGPGAGMPMKKKPVSPFMSKFMKKESKEEASEDKVEFKSKKKKSKDKDGKESSDKGGKGNPFTKGGKDSADKEGKEDGKPTFMMKKKCGDGDSKDKIMFGQKKCDDGKACKKCDKKLKKEVSDYGRPKDYDPSEAAFLKSIHDQLAQSRVNQKFDDGMRDFQKEDVLLPPPGSRLEGVPGNPGPGEVGYAPQGKIGDFTAESLNDMMKRIARLEKR